LSIIPRTSGSSCAVGASTTGLSIGAGAGFWIGAGAGSDEDEEEKSENEKKGTRELRCLGCVSALGFEPNPKSEVRD